MQLAGRSRQRLPLRPVVAVTWMGLLCPAAGMLQSRKQRGSAEDVGRVKKGYGETATLYTVGKNSNGVEVPQK